MVELIYSMDTFFHSFDRPTLIYESQSNYLMSRINRNTILRQDFENNSNIFLRQICYYD